MVVSSKFISHQCKVNERCSAAGLGRSLPKQIKQMRDREKTLRPLARAEGSAALRLVAHKSTEVTTRTQKGDGRATTAAYLSSRLLHQPLLDNYYQTPNAFSGTSWVGRPREWVHVPGLGKGSLPQVPLPQRFLHYRSLRSLEPKAGPRLGFGPLAIPRLGCSARHPGASP